MVCRGDAVGDVGVKNSRNAVGPSDGKTNGVRESIATSAMSPIEVKPLMNMNNAHTGRSGNRRRSAVRRKRAARPRTTSGSSKCRSRLSAMIVHPAFALVEAPHEQEQPDIQQKKRERRDCRRYQD